MAARHARLVPTGAARVLTLGTVAEVVLGFAITLAVWASSPGGSDGLRNLLLFNAAIVVTAVRLLAVSRVMAAVRATVNREYRVPMLDIGATVASLGPALMLGLLWLCNDPDDFSSRSQSAGFLIVAIGSAMSAVGYGWLLWRVAQTKQLVFAVRHRTY